MNLSSRTAPYDLLALRTQLPTLSNMDAGAALQALIMQSLDALPVPGGGETLLRWQALATVAGHDLSLLKLFEGHTDALSIRRELKQETPTHSYWGTWASEPPTARVHLRRNADGSLRLSGRKAWCSGAASVTHGLLTAWEAGEAAGSDAGPFLVAVDMQQTGVQVVHEGWKAVGMAGSASVQVHFNEATATAVGGAGDYLTRPGFWHGGAGIAACWYGAAVALAEPLRVKVAKGADAHAAAHLGAVDVALQETAALLRQAAAWIDQYPKSNAQLLAMRVRASAERSATRVLDHVGRALGATPFCLDADFARRAADLPVFLRQSHAERDLQALAEALLRTQGEAQESPWAL